MLLDTCSATATTATKGKKLTSELAIGWKIMLRATQPASQRDTGYKVEKVHPDLARHWLDTRTSMMVEGYVRRADGGRSSGGESNWRVARDKVCRRSYLGYFADG